MSIWMRIIKSAVAAAMVFGTSSLAQEVEPPFTWKGKGEATFIAEYGLNEIQFEMELSIDETGGVSGFTRSDEGKSTLKHVFYGERVDYPIGELYSRKVIMVILLNEDGGEPMVGVMNGRLLAGRFFYGELSLKRYEPASETDKALGLGDQTATEIDEDYLPSSLKSALKKCMPFGLTKIEGAYKK